MSGGRVIYSSRLVEGPLACCIGRVLVGAEGSLGYGVVFSSEVFGMSVEIAAQLVGTGVFLTGAVWFNLDFW
jgi:hypothetical protein